MFKKCLIYFHFIKETIEAKLSEEVDGQVTWKGVPNLVSPDLIGRLETITVNKCWERVLVYRHVGGILVIFMF